MGEVQDNNPMEKVEPNEAAAADRARRLGQPTQSQKDEENGLETLPEMTPEQAAAPDVEPKEDVSDDDGDV